MEYLTAESLQSGLEQIRRAPADQGTVQLIVRRPTENTREILFEATLDSAEGLVGDKWSRGSANPETQLTLMNARVASLLAGEPERRGLAGDQLYVDLDLSEQNIPIGTRLHIGSAVIEATSPPHLGCSKFAERFGPEARRFVNSSVGRQLRLRGLNAKIVVSGTVRVGDTIWKEAVR
jgi:MOSC domain-containing protein YiiM